MRPVRPRPLALTLLIASAPALLSACGDEVAPIVPACGGPDAPCPWDPPAGLPTVPVPDDNPMNEAKVELGRHLFYDTRLSGNQTQSCGTCHVQALAFTDGLARSLGSTGQEHPRSAMTLTNVAYNTTYTWVNPVLTRLETQALVPMFGETPVELGLAGLEDELMARLRAEPIYQRLFPQAFPDAPGDAITLNNAVNAIAAFQRTLISGRSAYDRYWIEGDLDAMSEAALRGQDLFFSERLECLHCHAGFNFSDSVDAGGAFLEGARFHNNALYNVGGDGGYPDDNRGLYEFTGAAEDIGRFRAPTLRNIALTAPYMHDGSLATLDDVIDHYAAGGRTIASGPYAGVGADNPNKSGFMIGFILSEAERADLLAFLHSLTDEDFVTNPAFSDPWTSEAAE